MRPNWQVFQARELTARAQPSRWREGEGGIREVVAESGDPGSHMVGALIVRQLLALNPGLDRKMLTVPQSSQEDWIGADKPTEFVAAMNRLWKSVGVRVSGESDPNRVATALWTLAQVAYLALPEVEIEAAREIAKRSVDLPWYGSRTVKTEGGERLIWGSGWEQEDRDSGSSASEKEETTDFTESAGTLSALLGGFGAGFGALRDELYNAAPEADRAGVMRTYDTLASNTAERRTWVKKWQAWAKAQGKYTAEVDGLWGPASESAWIAILPRSYGRPTTLADLQEMKRGGIEAVAVLAAGIARDKWIAANPNRLPPPPPSNSESTQVAEADQGAQPEEETVVVTPEDGGSAESGSTPPRAPDRVEIVLPEGEQVEHVTVVPVEEPTTTGSQTSGKRSWVPLAVGIGAATLLAGAFVLTGRRGRQPYEER